MRHAEITRKVIKLEVLTACELACNVKYKYR